MKVANKNLLVNTGELTLKEAVKLRIFGSLPTVGDGDGIGGVSRLLNKDLSESDHLRALELLRKIDHAVSGILLFARASRSKKGCERCNRDRVTTLATSRGHLMTRISTGDEKVMDDRRTQACSHFAVDCAMTCATRFSRIGEA